MKNMGYVFGLLWVEVEGGYYRSILVAGSHAVCKSIVHCAVRL